MKSIDKDAPIVVLTGAGIGIVRARMDWRGAYRHSEY